MLKRAIRTLWIALDELDRCGSRSTKNWRLNERHYGALQGLNKAETAARHGEAQVQDLAAQLRHPAAAARAGRCAPPVARSALRGLAAGRSSAHRVAEGHGRAVPAVLARHDRAGNQVGQAGARRRAWQQPARARQVPGQRLGSQIVELNIPTGIPLVYELDADLKPIRHYYLGDAAAAAAAAERVKQQAAAR